MSIEVTQSAFYSVFTSEALRIKEYETFEKHHYKDVNSEQRGFKIWNFVSSKTWQYYLTDINA